MLCLCVLSIVLIFSGTKNFLSDWQPVRRLQRGVRMKVCMRRAPWCLPAGWDVNVATGVHKELNAVMQAANSVLGEAACLDKLAQGRRLDSAGALQSLLGMVA